MRLHAAAALLLALGAAPIGAEQRIYAVDAAASAVTIHVGKAGLFKFAGHEHEVAAKQVSGEIVGDAADLARASVGLAFDAAALQVSGKGEPADDVPKVQAKMVGAELLDVARFPSIVFRSTSVSGKAVAPGSYDLTVQGNLTLHGATRPLTVAVHVEIKGDTLTASGKAELKHTDFGLAPVSVAGVVKVKNEIGVAFTIVARAKGAD